MQTFGVPQLLLQIMSPQAMGGVHDRRIKPSQQLISLAELESEAFAACTSSQPPQNYLARKLPALSLTHTPQSKSACLHFAGQSRSWSFLFLLELYPTRLPRCLRSCLTVKHEISSDRTSADLDSDVAAKCGSKLIGMLIGICAFLRLPLPQRDLHRKVRARSPISPQCTSDPPFFVLLVHLLDILVLILLVFVVVHHVPATCSAAGGSRWKAAVPSESARAP